MPDEQRREDASAEERLRAHFEEIEREEASRAEKEDLPPFPDLERLPEPPSNDEIRARLYTSPIESPLNPDDLGPEEHIAKHQETLSEMEDEVRRIGSQSVPEPPEWSYKRPETSASNGERKSYRGLALGITLAYAFLGPLFVGYGIGWLVDRSRGSEVTWQTWGTVSGCLAGFLAMVFVLSRSSGSSR